MARFSFNEADNYGASKNNYFGLKDDGDAAKIRFLYNTIDDVEGVATHEVKLNDRTIDVECLRSYDEPISNCPLCEQGYKVNGKLFLKVYDIGSKESKIWTRGKSFFSKISSLSRHYNPLVSTVMEVERNGKSGDKNTTYEIYPEKSDDSKITDFPEINSEGITFQVKSYDDLIYYLKNGVFPEAVEDNRAVKRDETRRESARAVEATTRRRPAYNNEDEF